MAHIPTLSTRSIRRLPRSYNGHKHTTHSCQTRNLWICSYQRRQNFHDSYKRHLRLLLHGHQLIRRSTRGDRDPYQHIIHRSSWHSPEGGRDSSSFECGWSKSSSKSGSSECKRKTRRRKWDDEGAFLDDRTKQHIEWIKKEVERDPYEVVFGRRPESLGLGSIFKLGNGFSSLCGSIWGVDNDTPKRMKDAKADTKSSLETTATIVDEKRESRHASDVRMQKPRRKDNKDHQAVRNTSQETENTMLGLQYDPISGRMISKKSNALPEAERKKRNRAGLGETGSESLTNADTAQYAEKFHAGKLNTAELECKRPSLASHDPRSNETEDTFQSTTASQDQISVAPSAQEVNKKETQQLETSQEAVQPQAAQTDSRFKQRAEDIKSSSDVVTHDDAGQPSQRLSTHNQTVSSTLTAIPAKCRQFKGGRERAGFLSARDKRDPLSTGADTSREQAVSKRESENLDSLCASDIRAAYDSRRLRIESEADVESPKIPGEPISYTGGEFSNHSVNQKDEKRIASPSSSSELDAAATELSAEPASTNDICHSEVPADRRNRDSFSEGRGFAVPGPNSGLGLSYTPPSSGVGRPSDGSGNSVSAVPKILSDRASITDSDLEYDNILAEQLIKHPPAGRLQGTSSGEISAESALTTNTLKDDAPQTISKPAMPSEYCVDTYDRAQGSPGIHVAEPSVKPVPEDRVSRVGAKWSESEPQAAETYRVFAYDPSSQQVTEAETNSTLKATSEHIHPTEALARLRNPAKFLPCLGQMHAEGYEIASGGKDILIFRKTQAASSAVRQYQMGEASRRSIDDFIEKGASQQAYDNAYNGNVSNNPSTGRRRNDAPKGRVRKVLRRMIISGAAMAGTFYALGVVSDYFLTGGEDGRGIDGFTAFESERRHREG